MDKEQEILQRLKQLREEQHKALKELKKVEKAKKKQRRRTAHGYSGFTESKKNNPTAVVTTPRQASKHDMGTFSKSCNRTDATNNKRKFTPNLKKEQATEKEVAAQLREVKVRILEPHKTEMVVVPEERCPIESIDGIGSSKRNSTNADEAVFKPDELISKPATSLDLTPKTSLFTGGKEENSPARVVRQKVARKLVTSPRLPRKVRNSLRFPAEGNTWRKSESTRARSDSGSEKQVSLEIIRKVEKISGTAVGKNFRPCEESSEVHSNKTSAKLIDHKGTSKDTLGPKIKESGEEKPWEADSTSLKQNREEQSHSTNSTVSSHIQPLDDLSQNIFSQSLFEDLDIDQRVPCEETTLKEVDKDDLSDRCEPVRKGNSQTDACESGIEARKINKEVQLCKEGKEKQINVVKSEVNVDCTKICLITSLHETSTDTTPNNVMQPERASNSPKEKEENRPMDIPTAGCSKIPNTADETHKENFSTVTKESAISQKTDVYLAAAQNELSDHENALLEHKTEGLRPDSIDMSILFAQSVDISADKQVVIDANFKTGSQPLSHVESEAGKQAKCASQELNHLESVKDMVISFDESLEPLIASQASPPFAQNVPSEEHSSERVFPIVREICLKHSTDFSGSSNEVRAIKFLTHRVGETRLDVIVVCLPRLLVLWKALNMCTWVLLHKWVLDEEEEIFDVDVTSVGRCIVLVTGGNFGKALGRVYCVHDKNDCKFDIFDEVSFSDLGEIPYAYKDICLLPNKESIENINIILASACREKIVLTRWTIDLICFCLEDCRDFSEVVGSKLSSLCLVQESKCLLLGCIDFNVYLWNYNSCELLCSMTLSALTKPVCLSAEASMGMIFLSLLYQEENKVELVAINPQTSREACLKTLNISNIVHVEDDVRKEVLCCSKFGAYLISSLKYGQILLCNIATDTNTVLDPKFGDVHCISLHPQESVIAFGTVSGCVYLNVLS